MSEYPTRGPCIAIPVSLTIGRKTSNNGLLVESTSEESVAEESAGTSASSMAKSLKSGASSTVSVVAFSPSTRSRSLSFAETKNGSTSAPSYIFQNCSSAVDCNSF